MALVLVRSHTLSATSVEYSPETGFINDVT